MANAPRYITRSVDRRENIHDGLSPHAYIREARPARPEEHYRRHESPPTRMSSSDMPLDYHTRDERYRHYTDAPARPHEEYIPSTTLRRSRLETIPSSAPLSRRRGDSMDYQYTHPLRTSSPCRVPSHPFEFGNHYARHPSERFTSNNPYRLSSSAPRPPVSFTYRLEELENQQLIPIEVEEEDEPILRYRYVEGSARQIPDHALERAYGTRYAYVEDERYAAHVPQGVKGQDWRSREQYARPFYYSERPREERRYVTAREVIPEDDERIAFAERSSSSGERYYTPERQPSSRYVRGSTSRDSMTDFPTSREEEEEGSLTPRPHHAPASIADYPREEDESRHVRARVADYDPVPVREEVRSRREKYGSPPRSYDRVERRGGSGGSRESRRPYREMEEIRSPRGGFGIRVVEAARGGRRA